MSRKQSVFSYAELQKMQARPLEKKIEEARGIGMDLVEKLDEAEFIIEMLPRKISKGQASPGRRQ